MKIEEILDTCGEEDAEYSGCGQQSSRTAITRDWVIWDYTDPEGERSVRIVPRKQWDKAYRYSVSHGGGVRNLQDAVSGWISTERNPQTSDALRSLGFTWLAPGELPYRRVVKNNTCDYIAARIAE